MAARSSVRSAWAVCALLCLLAVGARAERRLQQGAMAITLQPPLDTFRQGGCGAGEEDALAALSRDGRFSILSEAIAAVGLGEALGGAAEATGFTLLAPTDTAFRTLGEQGLAQAAELDLGQALRRHVITQRLPLEKLRAERGEQQSFETMAGDTLSLYTTQAGELLAESGAAVGPGVAVCGGSIAAVDQVLLSGDTLGGAEGEGEQGGGCESGQTALSILQGDSRLGLLAKAFVDSGLAGEITGPGAVTLLAPTDEAFAALGERMAADEALKGIDLGLLLKLHVIKSAAKLPSSPAEGTLEYVTAAPGQGAAFQATPGGVVANGVAKVVETLASCNGNVLVIDAVLLPSQDVAVTNEPCQPGQCCDIEPPGEFGCAQQLEWDKCGEAWMAEGGFCRESCEYCNGAALRNPAAAMDHKTAFVNEGILYQQWTNLRGDGLGGLVNSRKWRDEAADFESRLESFDAPRDRSGRDNTGARLSGFFCAPETGLYSFYLSSDDSSRLAIADTAADTEPQRVIARVNGWKRRSEWVEPREKVTLQAGKAYFLQALHKNGGGAGHFRVALELPSGEVLPRIPASMFTANCEAKAEEAPEEAQASLDPSPAEAEAGGAGEGEVEEGRKEGGEALLGQCGCTPDGISGEVLAMEGCVRFADAEPGETFAQFGRQLGDRVSQQLEDAHGWDMDDASQGLLGRMIATGAAALSAGGVQVTASICYVGDPQACHLAQPSVAYPGAAYVLC